MDGLSHQGPGGWMPQPYGYLPGFQPGLPPPFGPGAAMFPGMPYPWMGGPMHFPQYQGGEGGAGPNEGGEDGSYRPDPASVEGGYGQPPAPHGMPAGMPYPPLSMYGMGGPQYMQYPMMQQAPGLPPQSVGQPPLGPSPHGLVSGGPSIQTRERGGAAQAASGGATDTVGPFGASPPEAFRPEAAPAAAPGDPDGSDTGEDADKGRAQQYDFGLGQARTSSADDSGHDGASVSVPVNSSLYTAHASSLTLSVPTNPDEVGFGWVWRSQARAGRWHTFLRQVWGRAPVVVRAKSSGSDQAMHFDVGSTAPVPEAVFFHWLHRCRRTYLDDLIRVHLAQRRNGVLSRELAIHVLCEIARATVLRSNRGYLALPRTPAAIRAFETALRDALRPHQPLVADVVGVPQLEARLLPFEAAGQTGGGGDRGMEMGHAGHAPGDSDGSSSVGGGAKVPESTGDSTVPAPASGSSTGEGAYTGEERGDGPARGRHAALQDSAHAGGIEAEAPPRLERAPAEEEVARSAENAGVSSPDSDQGGLSQWDTSEHTFVRQREPEAQPVRSDANERKRRRASHSGDGGDGGAVDTAGRVGVEEPGRGHRAGETRPAAKRQRPETGPGPDAPPDGERQDSAGSAPASVSGAEDGWDSEEDDAASASGRGLRSSAAAQAISASDVVWSHPALHAAAFASLVDLNVPGTFRSLLDVPAPSWGAHPDSSPGGGGGSFADQPGATPAGLPARPAPTPAAATPAADPASEAWGGAQPGPDAAPPAEAEVWSTAGSDPGSVSTSIGEAGVMGSVIGPVPHVPPRTSEQWSLSPAQSADASRSMRELRLQLTQSLWRRCDYQDAKLKLIVNLFADEFALWGLLPRLKRVRKHDTQQLLYSMLVLLHPGDGDLVTALDNVRGKLLSTAFLAARGEIAAVMRDPRRRIQLAQSIIRDTPSQLVTAVARALSQKSKLADSVLRGLAEALKPVLGADAV